MQVEIQNLIKEALKNLKIESGKTNFSVEHPADLKMGDYSTNVAFVLAKELKINPKELAGKIVNLSRLNLDNAIEKIEVAGPGFINFCLSKVFFQKSIKEILEKRENFGKNTILKGKKVIIEFTDPNPFKEFHIGHLMSNTIGESISRIIEWSGAETKRANYQGDVGMHVAKAILGIKILKNFRDFPKDSDDLDKRIKFLADCYTVGSGYIEGVDANKIIELRTKLIENGELEKINKLIYTRVDKEINYLYDTGKKWSLDYFEKIYKKLGTFHNEKENRAFDFYFFESEVGGFGKETVEKNLEKVFEKGDKGAIVFRGEKFDKSLHTRVFINSEGLPTYEAKELGLVKIKYDKYNYDRSIIITGNEINEYFKVLLCAIKQIFPELAEKTLHFSHGMLHLPTGKMSSRTGDVITAEHLINVLKEKVHPHTNFIAPKVGVGMGGEEKIAVGAIKYMILRQAVGGDIIFDLEKSVSTEGDSGVYLQYSYARANSILEKAKESKLPSTYYQHGMSISPQVDGNWETNEVEKLLYRFPEVVLRSGKEFAPHYIVSYLIELARAYNSFYGNNQIINKEDSFSPYKIALSEAFSIVMKNGLSILGVPVLARM